MGNSKIKAQVAIEFIVTLFCLLILLVATTKIFVWFGNSIVGRHTKYEASRSAAATGATTASQVNFYNQKDNPLDIFKGWNLRIGN